MPEKCDRKTTSSSSEIGTLTMISESRRNKPNKLLTPISKSIHAKRRRTIGECPKQIFILRSLLKYPSGIDAFTDSELISSMNLYFHREFAMSKSTLPPHKTDRKSLFFSSEEPTILFPVYLRRSVKYGNIRRFHFLKAIQLLRRIAKVHGLALNVMNFHRLYITSLTIAMEQSQFVDDELMARIGGVPSVVEMRKLKQCFKECLGSNTEISFRDMEEALDIISHFKTAAIDCENAVSEMTSHWHRWCFKYQKYYHIVYEQRIDKTQIAISIKVSI